MLRIIMVEIIRFSAISQSFQTEVSKGVKLAQYVEILGNNRILETKNFAELGQILKLMYDNSAFNIFCQFNTF
jgi:hypothetical protein